MDIRKKFLKLTKRIYPYGFEDQLASHLPTGYFKDRHGNYYYKIGESKTAFTCHLDTASKTQVDIVHKFDKNIISTDAKSSKLLLDDLYKNINIKKKNKKKIVV